MTEFVKKSRKFFKNNKAESDINFTDPCGYEITVRNHENGNNIIFVNDISLCELRFGSVFFQFENAGKIEFYNNYVQMISKYAFAHGITCIYA